MKMLCKLCACLIAVLAGLPAWATLNVVACEPEWAALARELGGDMLTATSVTTASQDPHHIEARPSLIARVRSADLLVCTGMELEVGWLPVLIRQSANTRLAPGSPNHFEAGRFVAPLEVPVRVDRSDGDVHAGGNPHIHLDPRNIAKVAAALAQRLALLDAPNASFYAQRHKAFAARWADAVRAWEQQAVPLRDAAVVVHHKSMSYLWAWLGVREVATLQPRPGVEPGAGHLGTLKAQLARQPAKMVVRVSFEDARASQWLAGEARIPVVVLPYTVGSNDKAGDLFALFDNIIALLLAVPR